MHTLKLIFIFLISLNVSAGGLHTSLVVKLYEGTAVYGASYAKSWKEVKKYSTIPEFSEVATGDKSYICARSDYHHGVLILPNSRIRVSTAGNKDKKVLRLLIYQGSVVTSSPTKKHEVEISNGEDKLAANLGKQFAVTDKQNKKFVFGSIFDNAEFHSRNDKKSSISLNSRQYIHSSDVDQKNIRKFSWAFQKRIKEMIDSCSKRLPNLTATKKETGSLYSLLLAEQNSVEKDSVDPFSEEEIEKFFE